MEKLSFNDYLLLTAFSTISILLLFLSSSLGKIYLPIDSYYLENNIGIKLDSSFKILSNNDDGFDILVKRPSTHILSVIFINKPISKKDIMVTDTSNEKIKNFWQRTGLSDVKIYNCFDKSFYNNSVYICDLKAEKKELNSKTFKEGNLAMVLRKNNAVFFASIASLNAYNNSILISLLERISEK